jgi:hypothetical protein
MQYFPDFTLSILRNRILDSLIRRSIWKMRKDLYDFCLLRLLLLVVFMMTEAQDESLSENQRPSFIFDAQTAGYWRDLSRSLRRGGNDRSAHRCKKLADRLESGYITRRAESAQSIPSLRIAFLFTNAEQPYLQDQAAMLLLWSLKDARGTADRGDIKFFTADQNSTRKKRAKEFGDDGGEGVGGDDGGNSGGDEVEDVAGDGALHILFVVAERDAARAAAALDVAALWPTHTSLIALPDSAPVLRAPPGSLQQRLLLLRLATAARPPAPTVVLAPRYGPAGDTAPGQLRRVARRIRRQGYYLGRPAAADEVDHACDDRVRPRRRRPPAGAALRGARGGPEAPARISTPPPPPPNPPTTPPPQPPPPTNHPSI